MRGTPVFVDRPHDLSQRSFSCDLPNNVDIKWTCHESSIVSWEGFICGDFLTEYF